MFARSTLLVSLVLGFHLQAAHAADLFDFYLNPNLNKLVETPTTKEVKQLTPEEISDNDRVLDGIPSTFLVVKTNQGRNCKLLVQMARQKVGDDKFLPVLLVERYITFRESEEQTIHAQGKMLSVFPGFRLSLDLGQIVPEELGGDIRLLVDGDKVALKPVGKARLFLVTKGLPNVTPPKGTRVVVGKTFEPQYFNGTYKLFDDGRRSGKLILKVDEDLSVTGALYSDRDGARYEVRGRVGMPNHTIQFTVQFPRTEQTFSGYLFTGDAAALVGTSRLVGLDTGFYAVRIED